MSSISFEKKFQDCHDFDHLIGNSANNFRCRVSEDAQIKIINSKSYHPERFQEFCSIKNF
jgi:hypothetical protein